MSESVERTPGPVDPEDLYDGPDDDCPNCGGTGAVEDCFEDTCVCIDPPCCWAVCDWCEGRG